MTPGAVILARLEAAGLHLRAEGGNLVARPREAVTDELRALMRGHKAELLAEIVGRARQGPQEPPGIVLSGGPAEITMVQAAAVPSQSDVPAYSPLEGLDCSGCNNLDMRQEWHTGTRRVFFWRCRRGYVLLEGRNYGERIILAPPECKDFEQWKAGTR